MGKSSQLGWVLAVGGLGVVGFYLFKKSKPTVANEQLASIDKELGTIKAKSEEAPKTEVQLGMENIQNMTQEQKTSLANFELSSADLAKINIDFSKDLSGLNQLLGNSYGVKVQAMDERVANEYPLPAKGVNSGLIFSTTTAPNDAYDCIKLDVMLRDLILKIDLEQKKVFNKEAGNDQLYVERLQNRKQQVQLLYDGSTCGNKIETLKLNESAALLTKGAIIQENLVASKSNTDQQIYIGVGALVAITGLYMILKK